MATLSEAGFIDHRGHRVWWGATAADGVPVLVIHGGPGMPHDCLEPLAGLARRVVFYDQYGCGRSDRAADPADYDVEMFVDELAQLRRELALDRVHLFAHSYGGLLAMCYLLAHPGAGVVSLTLSNSFASVPTLVEGWRGRVRALGPEAEQVLLTGATDRPEYRPALGAFVQSYVFAGALPEPVQRAMQASGAEVYVRLHGSSWFTPDGLYAGVDLTGRLGEITVPTLVVGGRHDQCVPGLAEAIHAGVEGSQLVLFDGRHFPFFEEPGRYLRLLDNFQDGAEQCG